MTICVDIPDRLYDYTDEEKAAHAVGEFQYDNDLDDAQILALWDNEKDPRRLELETRIVDAVELNGTVKRARYNYPTGIMLMIDE